eukprot:TRINITY_DN2118_c0_g1_i2.p1 TRINITY_DN2118_c0_g1~~TRINITY_DN2118_c0_g1_i2.p1  ORF type:complete len:1001 (-),score=88.55 TRINITY_DN2118_c0_g1_i2:57-3059(-)
MTGPRSGPPTRPLPSGRQPLQAHRGLGGIACERVGSSDYQVRVSSALAVNQGTTHLLSPSLPPAQGPSGLPGPRAGGPFSPLQGGNGGSPLSLLLGLLWENLRGSQGFGRLETCTGPLASQPLPRGSPVSHGDCGLNSGCNAPWRLGCIDRPEGCLLPPPGVSTGQEVAAFCLERQSLSVQGTPLRVGPCTLGVLEDHQGALLAGAGRGRSPQSLSGRLAHSSLIQRVLQQSGSPGSDPVPAPGFHPQRGEVRTPALSAVRVSGHVLRHHPLAGVPSPPSPSSPPIPLVPSARAEKGFSEDASFPTGSDGVVRPSDSTGPPSQASVPTLVSGPLVSNPPVLGPQDLPRPLVQGVSESVARRGLVIPGRADHTPSSSGGAVHGRLLCGLGSSCELAHGSGPLGGGDAGLPHQQTGTRSRVSGPPRVQAIPIREASSPQHGQHHGRVLHQQTGGRSLSTPVEEVRGAPLVVREPGDIHSGETCPGQAEHSGRLPQPVTHGATNRMDSGALGAGSGVGDLVQTPNRPVRHNIQPSSPSVRVSSSGPSRVGSGRVLHTLDGPSGIRLPSIPNHGKGSQKGTRGRPLSYPSRSALAGSTLVPRVAPSIPGPSSETRARSSLSSATEVRDSSRESERSQPSRLASVRNSLSAIGASPAVVDLVQHAHRPGTQGVYSSHWNSWLRWCDSHSVQWDDPSSLELANFLAHLSSEKNLSASSVRGHRAAVCTTIRQLGGRSFSDDPLLRDVVRGISLNEARSPRRTPAWDLFLVLSVLRDPPFEPIRDCSLKHLTLKTAFLLSLASGRRCSEVHNFSGLSKDLALEPDGSMSIRFLPGFLAKNQSSDSPSPTISIKPLDSGYLCPDDRDRFLCPVRCLRRYLKRTRSFRSTRRRLLLSWNENYTEDIRRSTISRWLGYVIRAAYAKSEVDLAVFAPRPHEIRAWAASLAFIHTGNMNELLDAAYWKSPGTFIDYYLRDVSRLREDGSWGIASVVVAQQAISAPRTSSARR